MKNFYFNNPIPPPKREAELDSIKHWFEQNQRKEQVENEKFYILQFDKTPQRMEPKLYKQTGFLTQEDAERELTKAPASIARDLSVFRGTLAVNRFADKFVLKDKLAEAKERIQNKRVDMKNQNLVRNVRNIMFNNYVEQLEEQHNFGMVSHVGDSLARNSDKFIARAAIRKVLPGEKGGLVNDALTTAARSGLNHIKHTRSGKLIAIDPDRYYIFDTEDFDLVGSEEGYSTLADAKKNSGWARNRNILGGKKNRTLITLGRGLLHKYPEIFVAR